MCWRVPQSDSGVRRPFVRGCEKPEAIEKMSEKKCDEKHSEFFLKRQTEWRDGNYKNSRMRIRCGLYPVLGVEKRAAGVAAFMLR
jgi:hypothetical protein